MECNRDEALRAKEIAEQKFIIRDILGAKKFALKAQYLFPELEGINQMISTLDIYLAAEMKINGQSDWYAILCVNALADEETIKKQHRKLALQLHPDKNKSTGAEGAFHLVSEAWSVLSDESRKMVYDQMRNVTVSQQKVSHRKNNHSAPYTSNGFYNFSDNAPSNKRSSAQSSVRSPQKNTFWTSCNRCKMQYEYLRVYLNHNLLCPNCHEAFVAVETGFPSNGASLNFSWDAPQQSHKKSKRKKSRGANPDSFNNSNFQWGPFSNVSDSPSISVQAANMVNQTYENGRRVPEVAEVKARREEALRRKNSSSKRSIDTSGCYNAGASGIVPKKRIISSEAGIGHGASGSLRGVSDNGKAPNMGTEMERIGKMRMSTRMNKLSRDLAQFDKRSVLMLKAKGELGQKLEEWNAAAAAKLPEKANTKQKQKQKNNGNVKIPPKVNGNVHVLCTKEPSIDGKTGSVKQVAKHASIMVPDPEFHDFDKDRSERSFEKEQVWATYDSEDGMPRFYALIQKVISLRPFKVRMSFLNSKSNMELGPMSWVASGFAKTCGDFRVGRYEVSDTANIFSHRVKGEKGARGAIRIFPRKGETWALYKNWSPGWNELTPDAVIHKYDIVEVIDDYDEEKGVVVTPVVKVAGFRAVFHRHMDPGEVKRIAREEMFRFSHPVPSYLLTGDEAHNAPKGCRELDPAAIPSDLLQMSGSDEEISNDDEILNDEDILHQVCAGAAQACVLGVKAWLRKKEHNLSRRITRVPTMSQQPNKEYFRNDHMQRILEGSSTSCVDYLRMSKGPFTQLCNMIRELGLLRDSKHVNVEEQVAMFLHIVGHKTKNRVMMVEFIRSGETVRRYFNQVLRAIFALRDRYMKQPSGTIVPPEILNNPHWYPYFKGCIGMIDDTHVDAMVPLEMVARFRGRKGVTQNILAACTSNKQFTYILTGWEGLANDYAILKDALPLSPRERLRVLEGKYYLCDVGYTTGHRFISPYCGVRYHLKEHFGHTPKNRRELFNLRHSSLRTK